MPSEPDPTPFLRATKVIAVLDVVESVRLMEQDEHEFIQRWHHFVQFARGLLPGNGGRMHKSLGDGLMLEFTAAAGCVRASFMLQDWWRQSNQGLPPEKQVHLRIGAHLADFVADEYDIYGTDVNLAARIATLAGPGEIVVSASAREQLAVGLDVDVEDLGDCHLKHVKQSVRAYRVGPVGTAPVIERGAGLAMDLRPSIAVIPFAVRNGEPGQQLLGEALADEIIAALSRTSELHVISRLSTTVFRERHDDVASIREHLGASYILAGNCRTAGEHLVVFVELIDARNGHVAWAESLKGRVQDIFSVDDALISRLVSGVSSSVAATELKRVRTHAMPNLAGYTLLLGAVSLMHRNVQSDFDKAQQLLEHLSERARRHPLPYAWLAQWHVLRVQQGWSADPAAEGRLALENTKRALDADPGCGLAITAEGFVYTNLLRDLELGLKRYEQALDINPNDSLANLLKGTLHTFKGEGEPAVAGTEKALTLSPLDPIRYFYDSLAASAAVAAGRYERAIELAQRSLRLNRTHTSTYRALAIAQSLAGHVDEARGTVQELLKLEPSFSVSEFVRRSPSSAFPIGKLYADALVRAGLPR